MQDWGERMVDALHDRPPLAGTGQVGEPAPYADIRVERREITRLVFRDGEPELISSCADHGGMARALWPGCGWGIVTFTRMDFKRHLRRAWKTSQALSGQPLRLAPAQALNARAEARLVRDFRSVTLDEKQALLRRYSAQLMGGHPKVCSATVTYQDSFAQVYYANTEGSYLYQERPVIDLHLVLVVRDGEQVQRVERPLALAAGFEAVEQREDLVQSALELATGLLAAKAVKGGRYPVVMDPVLTGLFVHEAFGHLSEADFIMANPAAQAMMSLGRRLGPPDLNVVDDGSLPGLRGSLAYDDEGVPSRRTYLIRAGQLVGRLHSRETAAALDEQPTGNARATSYRHPPQVRMTNTCIEPGRGGDLAGMLAGVDLGLYACGWLGGETTLGDFTFTAQYARMIRQGELAEVVRNVTFSANVFETLANIDRIGSDFAWDEGSGDCGKGEEGLPVGDGGPHIRVQDVLVGG
ncbi:MAG: TldD/PmbA family protein [Thermoflexales bacterium]|nr:TldD/PmbA family protein [Thermoflexales bacterium]